MELKELIKTKGERHPKKHGEWYSIKVFDSHHLVYDTWSGGVYHYPNGAKPSDTYNLYHVVYVFYDNNGSPTNFSRVNDDMFTYWKAHINLLSK